MTVTNVALSMRRWTGIRRIALVAVLLVSIAGLSYGFAFLSPTGGEFSTWWPAAGVIVVLAIAVPRSQRILVLGLVALVTFAALYAAGRGLAGSIIGAVVNAAEGWIVTAFITDSNDRPRLTTLPHLIRFFIGVLLGAVLVTLVTALGLGLISHIDWLVPALARGVAHVSAIIVIVPVFLVAPVPAVPGETARRVVHALLLAAAVAISFSPGQFSALAFLPFPFLLWSAFSFSMSFTLFEIVGTSLLALALTAAGGGPFTEAQSAALSPSLLLQLYVVTLSLSALLVAAARNDRQQLEEQMAATGHLLYESFELSRNGFAIIQADHGQYRVLEANPSAALLLPSSLQTTGAGIEVVLGSGLHDLLITIHDTKLAEVTVTGDDELPVSVTVSNVTHSTFGQILLVSIIDQRPLRAAEEAAQRQLDGERAVVDQLRALNQQKDDFVSSVSHELRTPITTIIGFAEELEDTPLDETQRDYVAIVQRNAERLLSVVEDVLTFSRRMPGAAASALEPGDVDVTAVIASVLDDLRHSIRDKRITIVTHLPDQPVLVSAQQDYLARVIINLLTNSVKFTPADGTVEITADVADDTVHIAISDNGPGVAASDLDKVFDRFYRSSRAAHDGVPGTGLGLSIVRELVTEMSGTVVLESDGSSGTTARLTLPLASVVSAAN